MNEYQSHDEQLATQAIEAFQRDLLRVIQQDKYSLMPNLVCAGLVELLGTMLENGIRQEPESGPRALDLLEQLRARVAAANGVTQTRTH